ncbi:MAG: methyltransferase, partial [Hyphomicrobiales bacterium]|nr:methyltransferase [Hyphomicrobiales bacterium]
AATAILVDRSEAAARIARGNLAACGMSGRAAVMVGDWARALAGRFDVVVSNPPYIASAAIAALDPEVRDHDPRLALDGGADGLDAYRAIFAGLPRSMGADAFAVVELGAGQAEDVSAIARASGLEVAGVRRDLAGTERALVLRSGSVGCRDAGFAG